jgi:integrase
VKLYDRIAAFGLVDARPEADATVMKLGAWIADYTARRTDLKPTSRANLRHTADLLLSHFDATTPIASITPSHALDWRRYLQGLGYAEASTRLWARIAKSIVNDAVERDLIVKNPFRKLPSSSPAAPRDRYIIPAEADKILEACPDLQWRVLFGLARLAGLRSPSETHALTWADIIWDQGKMNVPVSKLERFPGKDRRLVPIVPKLMTILEQAFAEAPAGQVKVVTLDRPARRQFHHIIERAGLIVWPRTWQALRQSCQTQWDQEYGIFVSSQWIGHNVDVAAKHYSMIPDDVWTRATEGDVKSDVTGVENGAKSDGATPCQETQPVPETLVTSQAGTTQHFDAQLTGTRSGNPPA